MKIDRVQYDGEGQWLDVVFDDGFKVRLPARLLRAVAGVYTETDAPAEKKILEEQNP